MTIEGGCFCGAIRYRIADGDYPSVNCHCSMCRRTSAAPFVTWLVAPKSSFEYTRGTPKVLESSSRGTRYFCAECGTPIACEVHEHADNVDITVCSLDHPEQHPPAAGYYNDTRLPWTPQATP